MVRGFWRNRYALPLRWAVGLAHGAPAPNSAAGRCARTRGPRGLTLIEMLVAMAITLVMMGGVITMFGTITESISGSRATIEMSGRARAASRNLQQDLSMVTAEMLPPLRPEQGMGYFEYIEGKEWDGSNLMVPTAAIPTVSPKSVLGDTDDILLMTVRSRSGPFTGRVVTSFIGGNKEPLTVSMESAVAEVAWWAVANGSQVVVPNPIDGQDYSFKTRTLYRRVLLVGTPPETVNGAPSGWSNGRFRLDQLNAALPSGVCDPMRFFGVFNSDLSVHFELVNENGKFAWYAVANTLADLTKRENRHGHYSTPQPMLAGGALAGSNVARDYPFPVIVAEPYWYDWDKLGRFNPGVRKDYDDLNQNGQYDPSFAANDPPLMERMLVPLVGNRRGEDVMLDNVLAFDVRAFDPTADVRMASAAPNERLMLVPSDLGYPSGVISASSARGAYVDLNYSRYLTGPYNRSWFSEIPDSFPGSPGKSRLLNMVQPNSYQPAYDTWSLHYEYDGVDQDRDNFIDEGTDGVDTPARSANPADALSTVNDATSTTSVPGVDDPTEKEAPPPYAVPLRGIQVRIRQYETNTRQVKETTISQDFLPE